MTKGSKTTEFWGKTVLQILSILFGVLVVSNVLSVGDSDEILVALSIAIPALLEAFYAISRAIAKLGDALRESQSGSGVELIMEQIKTGTLTAALQKAFADLDFANKLNQRLQAETNEQHEGKAQREGR